MLRYAFNSREAFARDIKVTQAIHNHTGNTEITVEIKDGKNQKTVLTPKEEQRIIDVFNGQRQEEDFSIVVGYPQIAAKNSSLSAGQYFDVKIDYIDITPEQFEAKMRLFNNTLDGLFAESARLQDEIKKQLALLRYEG